MTGLLGLLSQRAQQPRRRASSYLDGSSFGIPRRVLMDLDHAQRRELIKSQILAGQGTKGGEAPVSTVGGLLGLMRGNPAFGSLVPGLEKFDANFPLWMNRHQMGAHIKSLPPEQQQAARTYFGNNIVGLRGLIGGDTGAWTGAAYTGNPATGISPTNTQVYRDALGAVGTGGPGNYSITGANGQTISGMDAAKWLTQQAGSGNWGGIGSTLQQWGLSPETAKKIAPNITNWGL